VGVGPGVWVGQGVREIVGVGVGTELVMVGVFVRVWVGQGVGDNVGVGVGRGVRVALGIGEGTVFV